MCPMGTTTPVLRDTHHSASPQTARLCQDHRNAQAAGCRPGREADGPSTVMVTVLHGLTYFLSFGLILFISAQFT